MTAPTRLLYFGSRTWVDVPPVASLIDARRRLRRGTVHWGPRCRIMQSQIHADINAFGEDGLIVVEGEADGADVMARVLAPLGVGVDPYPVDLTLDGPWPTAGHRRNARMAREGKPVEARGFITGDVGTPYSKGSAGMVEILRRLGIPLILHRDNGIEIGGAK